VDMGRDGSFMVGWGNSVRVYDAAGQPVGGTLSTASPGAAWFPQVTALPNGTFLSVRVDPATALLVGQEFILA